MLSSLSLAIQCIDDFLNREARDCTYLISILQLNGYLIRTHLINSYIGKFLYWVDSWSIGKTVSSVFWFVQCLWSYQIIWKQSQWHPFDSLQFNHKIKKWCKAWFKNSYKSIKVLFKFMTSLHRLCSLPSLVKCDVDKHGVPGQPLLEHCKEICASNKLCQIGKSFAYCGQHFESSHLCSRLNLNENMHSTINHRNHWVRSGCKLIRGKLAYCSIVMSFVSLISDSI